MSITLARCGAARFDLHARQWLHSARSSASLACIHPASAAAMEPATRARSLDSSAMPAASLAAVASSSSRSSFAASARSGAPLATGAWRPGRRGPAPRAAAPRHACAACVCRQTRCWSRELFGHRAGPRGLRRRRHRSCRLVTREPPRVVLEIAVEGCRAAFGNQPELVGDCAQQVPVVRRGPRRPHSPAGRRPAPGAFQGRDGWSARRAAADSAAGRPSAPAPGAPSRRPKTARPARTRDRRESRSRRGSRAAPARLRRRAALSADAPQVLQRRFLGASCSS